MGSAADFVIKNSKLKKYKGSGGAVVIPDGVTSIGNWAFEGCTSLTGIEIPNSVTSIGGYAFKGCTGLTGIEIPSSVISIGWSAFEGCTGLADIKITSRITSIGEHAFEGCPGLSSIKIPDSEAEIAEPAFEDLTGLTDIKTSHNTSNAADFIIKDGELKKYKGSGGVVVIPDGVTSIGWNAFNGNTSVTYIKIPDSVTSIGENAFYGCTGLTSITIPDSVIAISTDAFRRCTRLTNITIPDSVTSIGDRAFHGCKGLTSLTIPNGVTCIEQGAFSGCKGLTSLTIPNGVTRIEMEAFSGCTELSSVTIPNSVTSIDDRAFDGCTGLTSLTIPNSVTSIGNNVFDGCTGLTSLTIPSSVTSVGNSAFRGCTGLTSITIPDSVTSIGTDAFCGCTGLTTAGPIGGEYTIEFGWTETIPANAFYNCTSLTSVTIGNSVTSIGNGAFEGCTGLTGIEIPNSVTRIGERAFSGCTGLTGIEIPNSVTSIEACAFLGCTGLTSVKIPDSVTDINGWAFGDCNNLKELSIGNPKCKLEEDVFGETLPSGLINQLDMLATMMPASTLQKYILNTDVWCKLSVNRQAKFFLEQQGKDALAFYAENVTNMEELGKALLEELPQKPSVKECGAIALFMTRHSQQASSALLQQMYERLKPLKSAEKALKTIEANLELMTKLQPKTLSPLEQRMMEILQKQGLSGNALDVMLKEYYGITLSVLPKAQCKDGSTAPASALGWLLTAHEKQYEPEEYKGTIKEGRKEVRVAYTKPGLCPEAEEILAELDSASFQDFLHKLVQDTLKGVERGKKLYLAYPISRYADEERMAELVKIASSLHKKALVEILECASLYSNTHAAMLFADKRGCLRVYAELRRTTEDDLRDTILSDVGIDENGAKTYDLGNQIVTARMQADLSFLIELPDGKTAKSLPKKGADAEKYAAANTDFSNMKKNVKKIAKNRKDILFEEFFFREVTKRSELVRYVSEQPGAQVRGQPAGMAPEKPDLHAEKRSACRQYRPALSDSSILPHCPCASHGNES